MYREIIVDYGQIILLLIIPGSFTFIKGEIKVDLFLHHKWTWHMSQMSADYSGDCVWIFLFDLDGPSRVSDDALHWAQTLRGDRRAALLLDMAESEETYGLLLFITVDPIILNILRLLLAGQRGRILWRTEGT